MGGWSRASGVGDYDRNCRIPNEELSEETTFVPVFEKTKSSGFWSSFIDLWVLAVAVGGLGLEGLAVVEAEAELLVGLLFALFKASAIVFTAECGAAVTLLSNDDSSGGAAVDGSDDSLNMSFTPLLVGRGTGVGLC